MALVACSEVGTILAWRCRRSQRISGPEGLEPPNPDASGMSIFSAVDHDLGLKLEARKQQPVEVLVIEALSKVPTAN